MTRRILLVDDEVDILALFDRALSGAGWEVLQARSGGQAVELLNGERFDVIISDISMPGITGVELLRSVRKRDLDVPVVLITGLPEVETAIQALELGAMRYLIKPVLPQDVVDVAEYGLRIHRLAMLKRRTLADSGEPPSRAADLAGLEGNFQRALESLSMMYQPIVRFSQSRVYGYEALVRANDAAFPSPASFFAAAAELGRVIELGRRIRCEVAKCLPRLPKDQCLFLNLHPMDMEDEDLYLEESVLAPHAERIVLEISEQEPLRDVAKLRRLSEKLRDRGFRVAADDLGAASAGFARFVHLRPDITKLDSTLVRNVDADVVKQKLVGSILALCDEIGSVAVVEGVEKLAEYQTLLDLGADLFQGYLFGAPMPGFQDVPESVFRFAPAMRMLPFSR